MNIAKDRRARLHRALDRVLDRRAARDLAPHQIAAPPRIVNEARRVWGIGGSGEVSLGFIIAQGEKLARAIRRGDEGLRTYDLHAVEDLVARARKAVDA